MKTGAAGAVALPRVRLVSVSTDTARTLACAVAVTALAALIRCLDLGSVPYGLHGDEALTGLDARRILAEGWIGPYVYPSGLGQPAGPLYFTALVFAIFGESVATLRGSMAVFGVATVLMTFGLAHRWFGRPTAVVAALLLATMPWHFQLSRTAFMVTTWPLAVVGTCYLLTLACTADRSRWWSLVAGVVGGLGIYTYNAYPLALALYGAAYALAMIRDRAVKPWAVRAVLFGIGCAAAMTPMVVYALANPSEYWSHHGDLMLFTAEGWDTASWGERIGRFAAEAWRYVDGLIVGGQPDFGDGLSAPGFPPLNPLIALLAGGGVVIAARRRLGREPSRCWQDGMLLAAVVIFPWGALLTTGSGDFRRTLALAPFVAILAALPVADLWRRALAQRNAVVIVLLGATLGVIATFDVLRYGDAQRTDEMRHVYAPELRGIADALARVPAQAQVNFYSDRWSGRYETLRFLLPDLDVTDRATEFRSPDQTLWDDVHVPAVFVFVGKYRDDLESAQARFPGGEAIEVGRDDRVLARIYVVQE